MANYSEAHGSLTVHVTNHAKPITIGRCVVELFKTLWYTDWDSTTLDSDEKVFGDFITYDIKGSGRWTYLDHLNRYGSRLKQCMEDFDEVDSAYRQFIKNVLASDSTLTPKDDITVDWVFDFEDVEPGFDVHYCAQAKLHSVLPLDMNRLDAFDVVTVAEKTYPPEELNNEE